MVRVAQRPRLRLGLRRELLNPPVAHIGHVDKAVVVHGDGAGEVQALADPDGVSKLNSPAPAPPETYAA